MTTIRKKIIGFCLVCLLGLTSCGEKRTLGNNENEHSMLAFPETERTWKAKWITSENQTDSINSWTVIRKDFELTRIPTNALVARIAADSKYWLWINGEMVVREGGLKRGITPEDTYYDMVEIGEYLKIGDNSIAVLLQYFGKDGFSHISSGMAGFLFDLQTQDVTVLSDSSWKAWPHGSFGETQDPHPNFRLPESNILFDANNGDLGFVNNDFDTSTFPNAVQKGVPPVAPWNKLKKRIIPQWKDFGLKPYVNISNFPFISDGTTIKMKLPYNAQVNPYLKIESSTGNDTIDIRTDHYYGGGTPNIRGIYISKPGVQEFELPAWINGHEVLYSIPKGVKVIGLKYRETGYDTDFDGRFSCNDPFYNTLWDKAQRTLYVTMRDTYMDCPDRERAQWWGDVVLESGEAFYALDRKSDALTKKAILELVKWQRGDSTLFSPVPAGNWNQELPTQMLSSIGIFGFWNYYLHTGDEETLVRSYDAMEKYLSLWKLDPNGTLILREGGWTWGDWGENKDMPLLFNTQYYMALDSYAKISELLGENGKAKVTLEKMLQFKKDFNTIFWNGTAYRSPGHKGETDDRAQGLSVVAGLADKDKYGAIFEVLQKEYHASPYMEKYILEALFQMGKADFALNRMKERFSTMVNHPTITTLWEGWGIGVEGYGGGTTNHAWSGGGLTLLSQYVAGIYPTSQGYGTFQVKPHLGFLNEVSATVASIKGTIALQIKKTENDYTVELTVPENTIATLIIPEKYAVVTINSKKVLFTKKAKALERELSPGSYFIKATIGKN